MLATSAVLPGDVARRISQPEMDTMTTIANPQDRTTLLEQDQRFFDALLAADTAGLNDLLADDFILVAVSDGSTVTKTDLLDVIASGKLQFPSIESHPADAIVRRIGDIAIVVGRTSMSFTSPEGTALVTGSRYTHVFSLDSTTGWRLVSAQGTQITSAPADPPS
jgi:ketosteroid isomerase-like protein